MVAARPKLATYADLLALGDDTRAEILGGSIVEKALPGPEHGTTQAGLAGLLWPPFNRRRSDDRTGGWWIMTEVEVELATHEVVRPDLVGWRRDCVAERPKERPVKIRPDWVCEVLSPSNASTDLVDKFRVYERCALPHYWIADPEREVLTVYRFDSGKFVVALQAKSGETVRAEPFDAVELRVGLLFGEDD